MLQQISGHLVELLPCDLSSSVSFSEYVVGLVSVSPVSAWTVASPWPEDPPDEPEDYEYPEETEESEWEETEAVRVVAYWSEEDPANCRDGCDDGYEG